MQSRDPHSEIILKHLDILNQAITALEESILSYLINPKENHDEHETTINTRKLQCQWTISQLRIHMTAVHPEKNNEIGEKFAPILKELDGNFSCLVVPASSTSAQKLQKIYVNKDCILYYLRSMRATLMVEVGNLLTYRVEQLSNKKIEAKQNPSAQPSEPVLTKTWPQP